MSVVQYSTVQNIHDTVDAHKTGTSDFFKRLIKVPKRCFVYLNFKGPTFNFVHKDAQEAGFSEQEVHRGDMTKYYFFV